MDDLCLPVDGKGDVLVGDEDDLLLVYLLQHVDVLILPGDGEGDFLVEDENELLLVYLLQHEDVLSLPVDGEGDVLLGMRMSFSLYTFFSMRMFFPYL